MATDVTMRKIQNQDEAIIARFEFKQAVIKLAAKDDVSQISPRTIDIHNRQMKGDNYEYQDAFNALSQASQSYNHAMRAIAATSSNFVTRAYREWRYDQANSPQVTCIRTTPRKLTKLVFGLE